MEVSINGEVNEVPLGCTLGWVLRDLELPLDTVAIARNGEVVPRSEVSSCVLEAQDRVEVVRAVGGG